MVYTSVMESVLISLRSWRTLIYSCLTKLYIVALWVLLVNTYRFLLTIDFWELLNMTCEYQKYVQNFIYIYIHMLACMSCTILYIFIMLIETACIVNILCTQLSPLYSHRLLWFNLCLFVASIHFDSVVTTECFGPYRDLQLFYSICTHASNVLNSKRIIRIVSNDIMNEKLKWSV